jgi:phosphohistidine phosphatase
MELILWRHADAEAGAPDQDMARALTAKGRRQATKIGEWLDRKLPHNCRILVSPALRTVQTAEALGRNFKTSTKLAPGASASAILAAAHWPNSREPVLIVGHQPTLGQVAALLIAGIEQDWTIRKGSVCWIAQKADDETEAVYIKTIIGADMVDK